MAHGFHGSDTAQQAAKKIRAGDDPFSRTPKQDEIILDQIIIGMFLHDFHASDYVAEPGVHVPDDDRPVPVGRRIAR